MFSWLITSSADPAKTSLFIRSVLVVAGAYILKAALVACSFGLYCIGIDQAFINSAIDAVVNLATAILMIVASVTALLGLARKAYLGRWSAQ